MPTVDLRVRLELATVNCAACGCIFAIAREWLADLERTHRTFSCPNGHGNVFRAQSPEERLRVELRAALERLELRDQQLARERAEYDQLAARHAQTEKERRKLLRRATNGVCICC